MPYGQETMNTLTIDYPPEVLWALQQNPAEFEHEARLLLALKLYETGKLSTGLAAQLAGVPRAAFFYLLGQHGLSPFGETPAELEEDFDHARQAAHPPGHSE
jgi:predicted HTH domain antitoxin